MSKKQDPLPENVAEYVYRRRDNQSVYLLESIIDGINGQFPHLKHRRRRVESEFAALGLPIRTSNGVKVIHGIQKKILRKVKK